MSILEQYLHKTGGLHRELVEKLHALVQLADPGLFAGLKWGNLTYHHDHNVCAVITHHDHVNLQLWRGIEIRDPQGRLEGSGLKMRHI